VTVPPLELLTRPYCAANKANPSGVRDGVAGAAAFIDEAVCRLLGDSGVSLGGAGFLADRGVDSSREIYYQALPDILKQTKIFNVDITVGSTASGIHLESVRRAAGICREVAAGDISATTEYAPNPNGNPYDWRWPGGESQLKQFLATKESLLNVYREARVYPFWSNLGRLSVSVNASRENPFMGGGFAGPSMPERTVSLGVNSAGVLEQAIQGVEDPGSLTGVIRSLQRYSIYLYEVAEAVRFQVLARMSDRGAAVMESAGVVDLSLATTDERDREGRAVNCLSSALGALGLHTGAYGSLAGVGMLVDILKKAGNAAVTYAGGMSGAFVPVSEDAGMADAVANGWLNFPRYFAASAVCSGAIDMTPVWWPRETVSQGAFEDSIAGIFMDTAAVGVYNNKTASVRLLPVHYKPAEDLWVVFAGRAGLCGASPIMNLDLETLPPPSDFLGKNGAVPAPLTRFSN
jgi:uncharacterized protein (UPF0210 family)